MDGYIEGSKCQRILLLKVLEDYGNFEENHESLLKLLEDCENFHEKFLELHIHDISSFSIGKFHEEYYKLVLMYKNSRIC